MYLEKLQNVGLLLVCPLKPDERLVVVAESQVSGYERSRRNVAFLIARLQFCQESKGIRLPPSMSICCDQYTHNARTTIRNRNCFLQRRDCFLGPIVGDKHESKYPEG